MSFSLHHDVVVHARIGVYLMHQSGTCSILVQQCFFKKYFYMSSRNHRFN